MKDYLWIVSLLVCQAAAFTAKQPVAIRRAQTHVLFYSPSELERAVECGTEYGLCDLEELEELATGKNVIGTSTLF
jgi:hypothetical protein